MGVKLPTPLLIQFIALAFLQMATPGAFMCLSDDNCDEGTICNNYTCVTLGSTTPAPTTIQQDACEDYNGVADNAGTICCSKSCGTCAGRGCAKRKGGRKECCKAAISRKNKTLR